MSVRAITAVLCGVLLTGALGAAQAVPPVNAVPEPSTYGVLASGAAAAGVFLYSRTRNRRK